VPHAEVVTTIHAPWTRVGRLYRDFTRWPDLFPATIRGVRLIRAEPNRTILEIDHREGPVINILTEVSADRVDLWESKRRYDGAFVNRFEPAPEGTRYTVSAEIALKGLARLLGPFLSRYIGRQTRRYVVEPLRRAAEEAAASSPGAA
jgi:polyketide cyclase/dehydrase/lipid transport protein